MPSIRVDGWRSGIRFDAAHVIPHHPKCGRLHGHTYALHAEVHGDLDPRTGFVLDFGTVKQVLRDIADRLDHHVLVQAKSPLFSVITGELINLAAVTIGTYTGTFTVAGPKIRCLRMERRRRRLCILRKSKLKRYSSTPSSPFCE